MIFAQMPTFKCALAIVPSGVYPELGHDMTFSESKNSEATNAESPSECVRIAKAELTH